MEAIDVAYQIASGIAIIGWGFAKMLFFTNPVITLLTLAGLVNAATNR